MWCTYMHISSTVHNYIPAHTDIAVQLNLTLAMDRCDVAEEAIFIESRHDELKEQESMMQVN